MSAACAPPARLGLAHPHVAPPPACPLVYVAAGPDEIGLWDLVHCRCHLVGGRGGGGGARARAGGGVQCCCPTPVDAGREVGLRM